MERMIHQGKTKDEKRVNTNFDGVQTNKWNGSDLRYWCMREPFAECMYDFIYVLQWWCYWWVTQLMGERGGQSLRNIASISSLLIFMRCTIWKMRKRKTVIDDVDFVNGGGQSNWRGRLLPSANRHSFASQVWQSDTHIEKNIEVEVGSRFIEWRAHFIYFFASHRFDQTSIYLFVR